VTSIERVGPLRETETSHQKKEKNQVSMLGRVDRQQHISAQHQGNP